MATVIDRYSVNLSATSAGMQQAFERGSQRVQAFQKTVGRSNAALNQFSGGGKNASFAVQQLAFGLQDATSVYGMSGFRGAVMAASNNVIQFASLLNPVAGTVTALGLGIGSILVPMLLKSEDGFDRAGKAADEFRKRIEGARDASEFMRDRGANIQQILSSGKSSQLVEIGGELDKQIAEARAKLADTAAAAAAARQEEQVGVLRGDEEMMKRGREEAAKINAEFEKQRTLLVDLQKRRELALQQQQKMQKLEGEREKRLRDIVRHQEKFHQQFAEQEAREKERNEGLRQFGEMSRQLQEELNPSAAQKRLIVEQFQERRQQIAGAKGLTEDERGALLRGASQSARNQLDDLRDRDRQEFFQDRLQQVRSAIQESRSRISQTAPTNRAFQGSEAVALVMRRAISGRVGKSPEEKRLAQLVEIEKQIVKTIGLIEKNTKARQQGQTFSVVQF